MRKLKEVMRKYAEYTGQEMNVGKSKVVMQGEWNMRIMPLRLEGFEVVKSVRYLGIQLGVATADEQFAAPMKKFIQKMTFLQSLPRSEEERVNAIMTWACPVFSVVGKVVYPTQEIQRKVDALARTVMGIKSWSMTTQIMLQDEKKGGVGLCMPSTYLLHLHSKYYVQYVLSPNSVPKNQQEIFERWRSPGLQTSLAKMAFNRHRLPVKAGTGAEAWTTLSSSAKAYGQIKSKIPGQVLPMAQMMEIPLWDNTIFQTDTGVCYRCPKLMRMGAYQVADMIENGGVDKLLLLVFSCIL
uniref:Uncharacterized protein n=1 Tax=Eutreptiella gymnastica TaxID=73025 RepID=A0A7S1IBV4_9EUGL